MDEIDALHRLILDDLLREFHVAGLTETDTDELNRVWHRLTPWPDSVAGLTRLKQHYTIATLSNGNMALLTHRRRMPGCRGTVSFRPNCSATTSPIPKPIAAPLVCSTWRSNK